MEFHSSRLILLVLSFTALLVPSLATNNTTAAAEEDDVAMAMRFVSECKTELKLSDADVAALQKKAPFNPKTKCLVRCVAVKFELVENGKINEKEVMEWIEEEKVDNATLADLEQKMYNTCKSAFSSGSDECDKVARVFICGRDFVEKYRMVFYG